MSYFNPPEMTPVFDFIGGRSRSFYIPAYQRPFSWNNEKIKRLFEDVAEDMGRRMFPADGESDSDSKTDPDTVSFIGTVICFEDIGHKTVFPSVLNQVPVGVHAVIDGQQRITILIVAAITLHDYIRRCQRNVVENDWLHGKCTEAMSVLAKMMENEQAVGDEQHYPVMIRSFVDQWSTNTGDKKYISPISHFISSYGDFYRHNKKTPQSVFKYDSGNFIEESSEKDVAAHAEFSRAVKYIGKIVRSVCDNPNPGEPFQDFPKVERVFCDRPDNRLILQEFFNTTDWDNDTIDINNEKHCKAARAILLSAYLMKKVYFVSMVTKDENYAFDIFDSLNTTGEPLTAYETFKPAIMRMEEGKSFHGTPSYQHTEIIEEYLNSFPVAQRQKSTAELLVSFALAETGRNLSNKLHVQRKYLLERYEELKDMEERRLFTQHLMHVSEVWQFLWQRSNDTDIAGILKVAKDEKVYEEISQAQFCMRFLRDAGHTIAIPLISRFYEAIKILPADSARRHEKIIELCHAIKAVAAFFAIWRGSRETTEGIDNCYRTMMKTGIEYDDGAFFMAFNRKVVCRDKSKKPCIDEVKRTFCYLLKEKGGNSGNTIGSCKEWVEYAKDVPIYRTSRAVAKFLLLVACHHTKPCDSTPGHLMDIRSEEASFIASGIWGKGLYESIEHIIPQSGDDNLSKDDLDKIGNLTILPQNANSILSNSDWAMKRAIYELLSSDNDIDLKVAAEKAIKIGVSEKTVENLCEIRYLPMTRAIARYENFSADNFDERGEHLLTRAWSVLSKWLDFDRPL